MRRLLPCAIPVTLLVLWTLSSAMEAVDPLFLPPPSEVLARLVAGLRAGTMFVDMAWTLARALAGFVLAAAVGVPVGLLIGRHPLLAEVTQPTVDFFRSIPATALFPLFLCFFGIGDRAKIAIVFYACSLIILVNTAYGARQVKTTRIQCAKVMGASPLDVFWKIVVPESAPGIFAGLRIALSLAIVLIVVTEMFFGTTSGVGYRIMDAQMAYRTADMYVYILMTGAVGLVLNSLLLRVERRWLHWVGR